MTAVVQWKDVLTTGAVCLPSLVNRRFSQAGNKRDLLSEKHGHFPAKLETFNSEMKDETSFQLLETT